MFFSQKSYPAWLLLAVIFTMICTILYCTPGSDLPKMQLFPGADKVIHAGLFLGLSWLWLAARYAGQWTISPWIIAAALSLYGLLIEGIQYVWIEGRSGDWMDWLVDNLGILAALPGFGILVRHTTKGRNSL